MSSPKVTRPTNVDNYSLQTNEKQVGVSPTKLQRLSQTIKALPPPPLFLKKGDSLFLVHFRKKFLQLE